MWIQRSRHSTPSFSQILFSVLRKEGGEGRFLSEGATLVVGRGESIYFPLVCQGKEGMSGLRCELRVH